MSALQDDPKLVDNQDISIFPVKPSSSDRQLVVIVQLDQLGGMTQLVHQILLGELVGQQLQLGGDVLTQGVVHVKPITADRSKINVSIIKCKK